MLEKWSEDLTTRFLKKYRTKECLWNVFCPEYRNQQLRNAAYAELVQEMQLPNFSVERAKNKIKNLRSTYTQELKKMETSKGIYVTSLAWFDEINSFIRPMVGVRSSNHENNPAFAGSNNSDEVLKVNEATRTYQVTKSSNDTRTYHLWSNTINALTLNPAIAPKPIQAIQPVQPTQTVCVPEPLFVTVQSHDQIIEVDPMLEDEDDDEPSWQIENIRSERKHSMSDIESIHEEDEREYDDGKMKPPKLRKINDSMSQEDPLPINNVQVIEDEFDAFGRSVALQLKRMSLHYALNTQIKIQRVLTEMRLSEVDDSNSDVSTSETSH